jgi:uncharacterized membrane protein YvbJ
MKSKITLTVIIASLTLLFAACSNSTNTTTTANTANKSNTAVANSNQTGVTNTATNTGSSANKAAPTKDDGKIVGEYLVGEVKCTIKPEAGDTKDLFFEVKCADNPKAEIYSRDDDPAKKQAILVHEKQKRRFVFENNPSASGTFNSASGTFTDENGKTVKVTRVQ